MSNSNALTTTYAQVAADITALTLIQVPASPLPYQICVELLAASSTPSESDTGVQLLSGETIIEDNIPGIGTSGALYARVLWGDVQGTLLTMPDA